MKAGKRQEDGVCPAVPGSMSSAMHRAADLFLPPRQGR
jgi:hypothetical protein